MVSNSMGSISFLAVLIPQDSLLGTSQDCRHTSPAVYLSFPQSGLWNVVFYCFSEKSMAISGKDMVLKGADVALKSLLKQRQGARLLNLSVPLTFMITTLGTNWD
ncbi:hypothetical protein AMECASPLE_034581 [Ameca splendens]|uniref:Uncharacterized protein n=1 Tax=Ameca splendens TaxID=208324 RepID=A0ABV0Z6D4_9TELE